MCSQKYRLLKFKNDVILNVFFQLLDKYIKKKKLPLNYYASFIYI